MKMHLACGARKADGIAIIVKGFKATREGEGSQLGSRPQHNAGVFSIDLVVVEGARGEGTVPLKGEARGAAERLGSGWRWGPFLGAPEVPLPVPSQPGGGGALPSESFQMLISELSLRKEARAVSCIINDKWGL